LNLPSSNSWRNAPVLITGSVIGLVWTLLALSVLAPNSTAFLSRIENISFDWRVRWAAGKSAQISPAILAVAIDDLSLASVRITHQADWPWPRFLHGQLVNELTAQGARVIAFDILFLHPNYAFSDILEEDALVPSDEAFARELRQADNVLIAATTAPAETSWRLEPPWPQFATNALGVGHIVADRDSDGVLRRCKAYYDDPEYGRVWHLALLAAAHYLGLDLDQAEEKPGRLILTGPQGQRRVVPIDRDGFFHVDWVLRLEDGLRHNVILPYSEMLDRFTKRRNEQPVTAHDLHNRLVFVGSLGTGNNLTDKGATPLSNDDFLFTLHWNVANSILLDRFIRRSGLATEGLLVMLVGMLAAVVTWRLRALWASSLLIALMAAYLSLGLLLFVQTRYWLPVVLPSVAALLTHLSLVTYRAVFEQSERVRIKKVFSRVVAPDVVDELLNSEHLGLGGSRRRVSVFFADIRGFTRMTDESQAAAEQYVREHGLKGASADAYVEAQAREILSTVNLYLGAVADTIKAHYGTFDKYIGDCVMAFWGAPTPNERHAADCVRAAVEAQQAIYDLNCQRDAENRRRLADNSRRAAAGHAPLQILTLLSLGCGINTGVVTVGLMGSDQHILNYTVFGREVNLASRLEGASGRGRILISESTHQELVRSDPGLSQVCLGLPPVSVKGFREPVPVYEVEWRRLSDGNRHFDTGLITGMQDETGASNPGPA
jgi:adenylate cyclase